jgi:predicted DNA-binding transcriptional regulator AlpA
MAYETSDPILTEQEYRAWVGISAPTAQRQRSEGMGPPFVQLSDRRIGYRRSAVEQWLEARTISRVGEAPPDKTVFGPRVRETATAEVAREPSTVRAELSRSPASSKAGSR